MENVILKVDAGYGVEVEVGDAVKAGEFLGVDSKTGEKVFSPIDGVVTESSFDPGSHEFIISVNPDRSGVKSKGKRN